MWMDVAVPRGPWDLGRKEWQPLTGWGLFDWPEEAVADRRCVANCAYAWAWRRSSVKLVSVHRVHSILTTLRWSQNDRQATPIILFHIRSACSASSIFSYTLRESADLSLPESSSGTFSLKFETWREKECSHWWELIKLHRALFTSFQDYRGQPWQIKIIEINTIHSNGSN